MIVDPKGRPLHRRPGFVVAYDPEVKLPKKPREPVDAIGPEVPKESDEDE
jgi:hypothetical protein